MVLLGVQAFAQDLIITEISYNPAESGSDSTEYIEIYNNSASSIDLSGYNFTSGVVYTFYSGASIAAGDYFVVAVDSVAMLNTYGILADAEWTSGGLSNGGEPIALKDAGGVLVDSLRYDDVAPWPTTADGSGTSIVLCDVLSNNEDGTNWQDSQTSVGIIVNGQNVFGSPGADDAACSGGATVDTLAVITTADQSVFENIGTVDVTIELNQAPTLDKTVDLILTSGNAAVLGNYTTQTVTFTGGSTSETVTITVTPGQLASASETFDFSLSNPSTDLVLGLDTDFQLTVNEMPTGPAACSDLFFSEYIESSSNKALEIYNPTTSIIDLSDYEIRRYNNGVTSPNSTLSLAGTIIPGGVYVICNSTADPAILAEADLSSGITSYNGDDAIELYNVSTGAAIDIIGEIGVDPGTAWTVGAGSTEDVTMVRMASVDAGNLAWSGGSNMEWDTYGLGEYSYIGSHTNAGCAGPTTPVAYPIGSSTYCQGDTIVFTHTSYGGQAPYTVQWTIGGIPVSTADTVEYEAVTATTISVTLTVTDNNSVVDDSTFNITINSKPTPGYSLSANSICAGDTALITGTGSGTGMLTYSYSVDPAGTLSTSSATGNGYFTTGTDGTYNLVQTIMDFTGCSDTAMFSITVNPTDDASFSVLADVCADETLSLVHTDNSGTWSGTDVTDNGGGMGEFTSSTLGDHYITYTTGGVCPDSYTDTVEVLETPVAAYTYTGSLTVDFTDASTGPVANYLWDLGDGNTSTAQNPSHTYSTDGNYTVCLTVTSASGCQDSVCQTITIAGSDVTELGSSAISFFPNPTSDELNIQTTETVNVMIYNVIGVQVFNQRIGANSTVSLSHLESGSYFIQFEMNGESFTEKLIIE